MEGLESSVFLQFIFFLYCLSRFVLSFFLIFLGFWGDKMSVLEMGVVAVEIERGRMRILVQFWLIHLGLQRETKCVTYASFSLAKVRYFCMNCSVKKWSLLWAIISISRTKKITHSLNSILVACLLSDYNNKLII